MRSVRNVWNDVYLELGGFKEIDDVDGLWHSIVIIILFAWYSPGESWVRLLVTKIYKKTTKFHKYRLEANLRLK